MSIQCLPLGSYSFALNKTRVDLMTIGIQGRESLLLKYFPFDKIFEKYLIVDHYHYKNGKIIEDDELDQDFLTNITKNGFEYMKISPGRDYFFKNVKDEYKMYHFS